jgi:putative flavoprotein involved in K+ transport
MRTSSSSLPSTHYDVVVVGGGQAGLAIGHHLARQRRHFAILEVADGPAAAWRSRWDSLRLFTLARYSSLPGRPFPGDPGHHPTRDEVIAYLSDYAEDLPVQYGSRVTALRRTAAGYRLELADRTLEADQVVVATGPFQAPRVPAVSSALDPRVRQLHSSEYRNPAQVADGPVLVVGGGNTGYQIAEELVKTNEVHLAIGSRQTPLPQRLLGRDVFDVLVAVGAMSKTPESRVAAG